MSKTISPAQVAELKAFLLPRRASRPTEAQRDRRRRRASSAPPDVFRVPTPEFQVEVDEPEVPYARSVPDPEDMPAAIQALVDEAARIVARAPNTGDSLVNITRPDGPRIRRPANCFIVFRSQWRREFIVENPNTSFRDLSRLAGKAWGALSTEQQEPYHARARAVVWAHRILFPGWKYKPAKKVVEVEESGEEGEEKPKRKRASKKKKSAPKKDDSKKGKTAVKRKIEETDEEEEEWKEPVSKRKKTNNGSSKNVKKLVVNVAARNEETPEPALPSLDDLSHLQPPFAPSPLRYWEIPAPSQIQYWQSNPGRHEGPDYSSQGYQQAGPSRLQDDQHSDGSGGSPRAAVDYEDDLSISSRYRSQTPASVPSPGRAITGLPPSSLWSSNAPFGGFSTLNLPTAPSNEPLIDPSLFTGINGYRLGPSFQLPQYDYTDSDNYYLPADNNLQSDDFLDSMNRIEQASQEFYRSLDYAQDHGYAQQTLPAPEYPFDQPQYQYPTGFGHFYTNLDTCGDQDTRGFAHFDDSQQIVGNGSSGHSNGGPSYYGHANQ
ncbi:hypothetical protein EST38_g6000 [Candolleomyces aberdarensis]|uniref:HMG box domain-containing protein n=1 Tax=Candolleomyces aberdarensis TaxID=2316362 RepID=A0A4Q2DKU0_9AGAR|nr:hypothetical protein EST38_g6000 [Candolleomyces aberdarensis]